MPSKIEWTDETWNPVTGCAKVSQGCKHCYAERQWPRMTKLVPAYAGRAFTDVRTHDDRLDQPLRWKRPRMIFVNSMSDLFHEAVPDEFLDRVFAVMALARQHVFQVLTKRPERMRQYVARLGKSAKLLDAGARSMGYTFEFQGQYLASWPIPNVWLGVSVEDQATAGERIPLLLDTPAAVRWISAEPLLGPINLPGLFYYGTERSGGVVPLRGKRLPQLDWVVLGGESGPDARPMHPAWVKALRDQCAEAKVPFLFKQWGEYLPITSACLDDGLTFWPADGGPPDRMEGRTATSITAHQHEFARVGKKAAGRLLDGVHHDGYPGAGSMAA